MITSNSFVAESHYSKKITEIRSKFFLKEKLITEYFSLRSKNINLNQSNQELFKKNIQLNNQIKSLMNSEKIQISTDSINIIQGKIIKNSWNKKKNYITITSGSIDSVKSNMGVIDSNNHLIGITHTISNNFSTIISLLHIDLMISAKINNSGHYGTLSWDGRNPKVMQLHDIPKHANIKKGDTIITSGYSNILPEDIKIGKVLNYENEKNTNFLNICVDLFVDFTNIEFVYIIDSKFQSEREILEKNL
tara:strand:- start:33889 stop:34635 length:747 start_codon:yes stop_codon:yes gene_type:complete